MPILSISLDMEYAKMRSCTVAILLACVIGACAPAEPPLTLYEFDCGVIRFESIAMFRLGDDETDVRDLFVPCYVVEHPEGSLLWEGGLPSALAEAGDLSLIHI